MKIGGAVRRRFWSKVNKSAGCWQWGAGQNGFGYGCFSFNGVRILSHRFSWMAHNGPIPTDKFVLHKCDNRACVNPKHLWLGTKKDNAMDCSSKGRCAAQKNPALYVARLAETRKRMVHASGEDSHLSKLTKRQVLEIRKRHIKGVSRANRGNTVALAKEFGVSANLIRYLGAGHGWPRIREDV